MARGKTINDTPRDFLDARGRLLVQCWCQANYVLVPAADVRAGKTGSCGPRCQP